MFLPFFYEKFSFKKQKIVFCLLTFFLAHKTTNLFANSSSEDPFNLIEQLSTYDPIYDPFEKWNRAIFVLNKGVDGLLINPALTGAFFFIPSAVQENIGNVLSNLNDFTSFFNHLFQKQSERAGHSLLRFVVNSTLGVLGLFDVAKHMGLAEDKTNFNHTLRSWGISNGPYIVWPLLGPLTVRDFVGVTADYFLDPYNLTCIIKGLKTARQAKTWFTLAYEKEKLIAPMQELQKQSLDFYSSVRSVYYQNRHCDREKGEGDGVSVW